MHPDLYFVSLDSCRWDTLAEARSKELSDIFGFERATTHGTYTLPAHASMLQGILPHSDVAKPFYNRFIRQLIRLECAGRPQREALVSLPEGSYDIPTALRIVGYATLVIGAVGWFRSPAITGSFSESWFTGIDVARQARCIREWLSCKPNGNVFVLWNIGETHDPYRYGGRIEEGSGLRAAMRRERTFTTTELTLFRDRQVEACAFIQPFLLELVEICESRGRAYVIVVCGDHGECFGEDGLFGHGFYHPKVMEVPLGIVSRLGDDRTLRFKLSDN